jgi:ribosomal silencing factor RsfS
VFNSTEDRADFIKSELETNEQIRARTHVIVSEDTWLVIDTLAVIVRVMPPMGGMISGRNGANP